MYVFYFYISHYAISSQLTRDDQQESNNEQRWTLSRRPECGSLISSYEGDIRLKMKPALLSDQEKSVYGSQLVESTCNLPLNFTGTVL